MMMTGVAANVVHCFALLRVQKKSEVGSNKQEPCREKRGVQRRWTIWNGIGQRMITIQKETRSKQTKGLIKKGNSEERGREEEIARGLKAIPVT